MCCATISAAEFLCLVTLNFREALYELRMEGLD